MNAKAAASPKVTAAAYFTTLPEPSFDVAAFLSHAAEYVRMPVEALQKSETLAPLVSWLLAPAMMFLEPFGIHPSGNVFLAATIFGWLFWAWVARILYFSFARPLGLATPRQYLAFRRLSSLPWHWPWWAYTYVRRLFWQWRNHEGASQFWAGFWTMASLPYNPDRGGIPIGRLALFQRFGLHMAVGIPDSEKAVAVIAASGSGKSAWIGYWLGCIKRNQGACIFDMDGAFVNAFGAILQAAGHRVVKIDVDKINKSFPNGKWNPIYELTLAAIRHGNAAVSAFVKLLAEAIIVEDSTTQPVFSRTARVIIKAIILFCWLTQTDKSLIRVRQLLTRGLPENIETDDETAFGRLIFEMSSLPARFADGEIDDGCNGALCNEIANCCGLLTDSGQGHDTGKDTPDNFRKTAIYQTDWMDDANVVEVIGGESDIACDRLKLSNDVCFIVSTLTDTQTRLAPLVRAFTMLTIYSFQRTEPEKKLRDAYLLVLDEFPNLGRGLDICAVAAPGFRKFGLRLVVVSQSIGLLRECSPARYREFLNQSALVIWMSIAPTDKESLVFLTQDVLGQCMRLEKVAGWHWVVRLLLRCIGIKGLPAASYQLKPQWLLTPQQASAFTDPLNEQIIVTFQGRAPMRLKQLKAWKELPVWKYAVHKGHGETFLRSQTRLFLSAFSKGIK